MPRFNPYFEYATIFYLFAVLCCSFFVYKRSTIQSLRFKAIVLITIFACACDVIGTFALDVITPEAVPINYVINSLVYTSEVFVSVLYLRYVRSITGREGLLFFRIFHTVLAAGYAIMHCTNFKTHVFFYIDENLEYCYGPLQIIHYILMVYFVLFSSGLIIRCYKDMSIRQIIATGLFSFMVIVVAIIQFLFIPNCLLGLFAAGIAIVVIMLTLETPDYIALMDTMKMLEESKQQADEERRNAEYANLAKGKFLANMSHEIRTPINAIIGLGEIISKENDIDTIHSLSGNIVSASNTLYTIINDILDFSKMESGKLDIVKCDYRPEYLANDLQSMCEPMAKAKGLAFEVETKNLPDYLSGAEVRIRQIALNLTSNAIKYTKRGRVDVLYEYADGNLVLSVRDTGQGIREEDIPHLFDTFSRFEQDQNRHIEGTGLGLSIVNTLVQLMDGTIDVKSKYGIGSAFTVTIPQDTVEKAQSSRYRRQVVEKVDLSNVRILCVDDTRANLLVFSGLLKDTGASVQTAESPEAAVEILKEQQFDIMFFDYLMPHMNGIELFEEVRKMGVTTPAVALTADAINDAQTKFFEAGFAAFLPKPVKYADLQACIVNILNININTDN